jgi:hypothetical protein
VLGHVYTLTRSGGCTRVKKRPTCVENPQLRPSVWPAWWWDAGKFRGGRVQAPRVTGEEADTPSTAIDSLTKAE